MLLKKKDFWSALMKVSLPVKQYAGTVQAPGDSALFLPSYLGYLITLILNGCGMEFSVPRPNSAAGQMSGESGELRAANIVGGIK
jgi:hypothetical protein